ncbi:uncharacterized protein LTR77_005596 [Saxophila tyrrhenica]|uniref:Uncharacterized protein n=1 Tax=Saxophila tyrrhenica TaxID=1690608 RepID=A0AAV9P8Y3_9PEZI|nr:hypothetical protein LTR77_005596 [Saxophila tyrrhenica]
MDQSTDGKAEAIERRARMLKPLLERFESDQRPVVLLVCGCAGSGKSTLAKAIVDKLPTFKRVSFDGIVASNHGLYGIDYPEEDHEKLSDEADVEFSETAKRLLAKGEDDIVLDRAFYAKKDREAYKQLAEDHGARWLLVYLTAPKDVLWQRIQERRAAEMNADSARIISKELLDEFYDGFEVPVREGELVIDTTASFASFTFGI